MRLPPSAPSSYSLTSSPMASSSPESSDTGTDPHRLDLPTRVTRASIQLESARKLLDARLTHTISENDNGTHHLITITYDLPART